MTKFALYPVFTDRNVRKNWFGGKGGQCPHPFKTVVALQSSFDCRIRPYVLHKYTWRRIHTDHE